MTLDAEKPNTPNSKAPDQMKKGWKKQSLVGKMWEIYWDPKQPQSTNTIDSEDDLDSDLQSRTPPSPTSTDHGGDDSEESDYDADWYDAHVQSYSPESDIFEVSFVGEDQLYQMSLTPQIVRPLESESKTTTTVNVSQNAAIALAVTMVNVNTQAQAQAQVDHKWKDGVLGKDWEIYWDSSSSTPATNNEIHDDNERFCSDWYDAHIKSYCPETGLFQISFLGEDQLYQMTLTPDSNVARPSTRAWVSRTKFILDLTADQVLDENRNTISYESVCDLIPHSTERFKDASKRGACSAGDQSISISMVVDKIFDMAWYIQLLKRQLESMELLRNEPGEETLKRNGMIENSKEHVEYLASRIQLVIESCSWCHSTEALGIHANNDAVKANGSLLGIQDLHSRVFNGTVLFVRTLLLDSNQRPNNKKIKKRPLSQSPVSLGSTSSKRGNKRRITNSRKTLWASSSDDTSSDDVQSERDYLVNQVRDCEESCTDINSWTDILKRLNFQFGMKNQQFISSELIGIILQRYTTGRSCRYLSSELANCLVIFLQRTWKYFIDWIAQVKLALGSVYAIEFERLGSRMTGFVLKSQQENMEEEANEVSRKGCSLDDISTCLIRCRDHPILKRIDLSDHIAFLEKKVDAITVFQHSVWERIARGICEPITFPAQLSEYDQDDITRDDSVLLELSMMLEDPACLHSSASPNMATKSNIERAIKIRKWFIIAKWVLSASRRERSTALSKCYEERPSTMVHVPSEYTSLYDSDQVNMLIRQLSDRYTQMRTNSTDKTLEGFGCESSCRKILGDCSKNDPTVDILEEECAILADMFAWNTETKRIFSLQTKNVDFRLITLLHSTLQDIRKGICTTRSKLTAGLLCDPSLDQKIQTFIREQISLHCGEMELLVANLYNKGSAWYKRANQVVRSLKHYGNASVDLTIPSNISTKVNNFIELKVIDDLIVECDQSTFAFPDIERNLVKATQDAHEWVDTCLALVPTKFEFSSPSSVLQSLRDKCLQRPKGILMFPSRQLVGEWIELLDWHTQCTQIFDLLKTHHLEKSSAIGELTDSAVYIVQTNHEVEKLLSRGYELIHFPPPQVGSFHVDFTPMTNEECLNHFKSPTPISLTKIKSCTYSMALLRAVVDHDDRLKANGNLFILQLFVWRHVASDLLGKIEKHSRRRGKQYSRATLESAKALLESMEHLPESFESLSKADCLLESIYLAKYVPLQQHINDAEKATVEANETLNQINSERRTEITAEYVEEMSGRLKSIRSSIRSVNEFGLGVELAKSTEVERRIRDLSWMRSINACPIISDTKYSSARRGVSDSHSEAFFSDEKRVPLSFLVQIYEKAPSHCRSDVNSNACSLDSEMSSSYNRIRTVKEQLSQWKSKLHSFMPRSLRAIKRRDTLSRYAAEDALEEYDIVSEEELRKLQQHPLLRYVSIPEEDSLSESLIYTITMRDQLISIFAKDSCGHNVERIALPTYASLIGDSGDFFLRRVINHPSYFQLKKELAAIDDCAKNLPVRTLEKVTYDWVIKILNWIETVADAVFIPGSVHAESPIHKQCLSLNDTERLIDEGHRLFFAITEESKKYLLKHRLSVVTRASTGNVTVKSCKGGKNLSIGGTVLRWIAFVYNGMRNDLASTLLWTKRVQAILGNDQINGGSQKSNGGAQKPLSNLLEEATEYLVVAPNEELLQEISRRLKEYSHTEMNRTVVPEKWTFVHNLLLETVDQEGLSPFSLLDKAIVKNVDSIGLADRVDANALQIADRISSDSS